MKKKLKKIKCPICGKETEWENNPFRPFCSKKCKLADLHKWLTEEYVVEAKSDIDKN
ncbi:DNA gyrase inhibitor YacG [Desulfurobacterium sp.]|uniref:DNA gyrase inhibitor YacG n=1 Tax=Desulfurobacterium sp. TaxID=2004706 RepID=UPI00262BC913|nr:DNA gyrase inhibitor YacG [Desulfurobacterium sp.]